MAHDDSAGSRDPNGFLDLKTVVGGMGALIIVLGGITWGLLSTNHSDEVERNTSTNRAQWERLKDLNDQVIELRGDIKTLRRDVDELRENGRRR